MRKRKGSSLDSHAKSLYSRPLGGLGGLKQREVLRSICVGETAGERRAGCTKGIRTLVPRLTQDCQSEAREGETFLCRRDCKGKVGTGAIGWAWAPRGQV